MHAIIIDNRIQNGLETQYNLQWTLSALTSQHKTGGVSVGTFVNFVWVTIEENFLSDHISAKKAGKELKPTGMVIR